MTSGRDEAAPMAGSMRKIMAYLGLVDDEYDDYDELSERSRPARAPRPTRPDPRDSADAQYDDYDRQDRYGRSSAPDRPPRQERDAAPMGTVSRIRPVTQDGTPSDGPGRGPAARPATPPASSAAMVSVVAPQRFSDAKEIGDHIRQNNPVIVNLQLADRELQRRMIDFCSGIAYALGCEMERVADQVFLLTPTNVTISDEERARLQARGFNRS